MNGRLVEILKESELQPYHVAQEPQIEKFAELILVEAFRAGMLYSAKKYATKGSEYFTGNDVSLFLEMDAYELSDGEITELFGAE